MGEGWAPLHAHQLLHRSAARPPVGVKQIAVGPVLHAVTPGIAPIVKDLAHQEVAAHPPIMLNRCLLKIRIATHQVVEVQN
jgi:hypothetical protein